jgi:uncharacterized OsmC-like protein
MTATAPAPDTVRNGVPVNKLFATRDKLTSQPELAQFRFSAKNAWIEGTASQSSIYEWFGVGTDHVHVEEFTYKADHPTLGNGHGPTPHEVLLHALASCLTAGIATTAAARNIELASVTSTVTGEMDVRGVLAIREERRPDQAPVPVSVRPGFQKITVDFEIDGDADEAALAALAEASRKTSAVYDMLTGNTAVEISVNS